MIQGSELSKEQLLDYVKKQRLKIKKLENANEELVKSEELLKKQLSEAITVAFPPKTDHWDSEREYLQSQLDEKSREIFALKSNYFSEMQSLKDNISKQNTEIEQLKISSTVYSDSLATIDLAKAGEEITLLKQKLTKYNSILKSKMKDIEDKDKQIKQLQETSDPPKISVHSRPSSVRQVEEEVMLVFRRVACSNLKNVEIGGTLSGMLGGTLGGALGSALGGNNDPFVVIRFPSFVWSLTLSTVQEAGPDASWENINARLIFRNDDLNFLFMMKIRSEQMFLLDDRSLSLRNLRNSLNTQIMSLTLI
jgi:hypothetical protein